MKISVRSCCFVLVAVISLAILDHNLSYSIEPEEVDTVVNMVQWRSEDGGNDHWYAVFPFHLNWHYASYFSFTLKRHGRYGHLACISSTEENRFVVDQVLGNLSRSDVDEMYWIGGRESAGRFQWVSWEPFNFSHWAGDNPRSFDRESDLAILGPDAARSENQTGCWINVERPPRGESWRTARAVVEWDYQNFPRDTLLNLAQWTKSEGGNDHWYAVMPQIFSWTESDSLARTMRIHGYRGYLATLTSIKETDFVRDNVMRGIHQPSYFDQLWLGGVDADGMWAWVTGEPFIFTNWCKGKLDNVGIETVMAVWGWDEEEDRRRIPGTWNNSLPHRIGNYGVVEFGGLLTDSLVPTDRWVNLYCQAPTLNGQPLAPGSVVCAYDPDGVLCGVDTVRVDGSFGFLIVYGDDLSSTVDEGAMPGDEISLIIDNLKVETDSTLIWTSNGDIMKVHHDLRFPVPGDPAARNEID